jgi:hypothetical protein
MDISWKQTILALFAMSMVIAIVRPSAFDEPVPPPPKVKVVTRTKVVERKVEVVKYLPAGKPPDGYMSRSECFEIPEDMPIAEVMYRFGWPAGRNGRTMGLGSGKYPIREDHGASCTVLFPYGTVSTVIYRHDADDWSGTETFDD